VPSREQSALCGANRNPDLIQVYFNSTLTYGLMRLRVDYSVAASERSLVRKQNHETRDTQNQADSVGNTVYDFFERNLTG
jgi:hypothetical protein